MPQQNTLTSQNAEVPAATQPVPIAPSDLAKVSGAGPNGGWSQASGPNGGWY